MVFVRKWILRTRGREVPGLGKVEFLRGKRNSTPTLMLIWRYSSMASFNDFSYSYVFSITFFSLDCICDAISPSFSFLMACMDAIGSMAAISILPSALC